MTESLNDMLHRVSIETGIPIATLRARHYGGIPLDKVYHPRTTDPTFKKNARQAMADGSSVYEGSPCRVCKSTTRYVSSGSCRRCMLARGR